MRIHSIVVRNYRLHRDLRIELRGSLTLVGGPNECGKSTLVEALHRGLFLKSKGTSEAQRRMLSTCFPGAPEVEVRFTVGLDEYVLSKRFSGVSGTTRLIQAGGQTWHGDEAESRVAALLRVETLGGGRGLGERIGQQWSHLWVWQGQGGRDPSEHATSQREALLQRLQAVGGAAALQSELDARLAARFSEALDHIFVPNGKAKVGSDLEKAEGETKAAAAAHQQAVERRQKLRDAVRDFEEASLAIAQTSVDLEKLVRQREELDQKLKDVADLRRLETAQLSDLAAVTDRYQAAEANDRRICETRRTADALERACQPAAEALERLASELKRARDLVDSSAVRHEDAAERARSCRRHRDLAVACVGRAEKEERLNELLAREIHVLSHQECLLRLRQELVALPDVTVPKVNTLEKLQAEVKESEAALSAMAAGIEVLACREPIRLGDQALGAGETHVVTERTELTVGDGVRLRISPGGGLALDEARTKVNYLRGNLQEQLDSVGLASVRAAAEALTRRKQLATDIEKAEASLETLGAAALPATLAKARQAATAAAAEVERRVAQVPDLSIHSAAELGRWVGAAEGSLEAAERDEKESKTLCQAAHSAALASEAALAAQRKDLDHKTNQINTLRAQLSLLLESHGQDVPRAQALSEALATRNRAEAVLATTRKSLADLQPGVLEDDHVRLKRALSERADAKADAEKRRVFAEAALRLDGSEDPEEHCALATARLQSAEEHAAGVRRKAEAIGLLHQLFSKEQQALADEFTRPLAQRVSTYLQCLFGPEARAIMTLGPDGFAGLQLVRPSDGPAAGSFDALSGGAREQVAAAVRLAMAEILAADHDGCLPVVFDDAFAYSDPERVQVLQRMLDLAAAHGLQLIVLTCNPSDYAGLGAHQITLRREMFDRPMQAVAPPMAQPDGEAAVSPPHEAQAHDVTDAERDRFVTCLAGMGGKAGNASLRHALDWDEGAYTAIKDDLLASGKLRPGKGRGGSVVLASNPAPGSLS